MFKKEYSISTDYRFDEIQEIFINLDQKKSIKIQKDKNELLIYWKSSGFGMDLLSLFKLDESKNNLSVVTKFTSVSIFLICVLSLGLMFFGLFQLIESNFMSSFYYAHIGGGIGVFLISVLNFVVNQQKIEDIIHESLEH